MKFLVPIILLTSLVSCGAKTGGGSTGTTATVANVPVGSSGQDGVVIVGRATVPVQIGEDGVARVRKTLQNLVMPMAYAAIQPVTVVLAPNTTMTVDSSNFIIPAMENAILNFGTLDITTLNTNDLRKCGGAGKGKCSRALIRVYTTGTTEAGFFNAVDGYGVPLLASGVLAESEVGLNISGAHMTHEYIIPGNKNVVNLNDFGAPKVAIKGNFANAGAGSYSTTINIEFALAP